MEKHEWRLTPAKIAGYVDPPWMEDLRVSIEENDNILLVGHCGTGKTSAAEQIAARAERDLVKVNLNGQTNISALIGKWIAKDGSTIWVDGMVTRAVRDGFWLILDEIDFAEPDILASLHGLLDSDDRHLILDEKDGEVVAAHPEFRIMATANSIGQVEMRGLYSGTKIMNEAFLDRWNAVYEIKWPEIEMEAKIIMARAGIGPAAAVLIVKTANELRKAFSMEQVYSTFSTRRCIQWARQAIRYADFMKGAELSLLNKLPTEDREVFKGVIQRMVGGKTEEEAAVEAPEDTNARRGRRR